MKDIANWIILLEMKGIKDLLKASLILSLLFIILAGQFTHGDAQSSAVLSIEPSTIEVPLGNRVQLELEVDNGINVHAFDLMINYDMDRLLLVDWEHGDYLSDLTCTHLIRQPGVFELACNQLSQLEVDGDGVLLILIFDSLGIGFPDVTITEATLFNVEGSMSFPQRQHGVVEVTNTATYTSTPTITRTPTQTLTPTPSPSFTPSPLPTATATFTPFLSPTENLTATDPTQAEELETPYPGQTSTAALQTAFALTETAAGALIPPETTQPGETGTPQPLTTEEGDTEASQSQNLIKNLWRVTLWGVLIFAGLVVIVLTIIFVRQRTQKDDDGLLL